MFSLFVLILRWLSSLLIILFVRFHLRDEFHNNVHLFLVLLQLFQDKRNRLILRLLLLAYRFSRAYLLFFVRVWEVILVVDLAQMAYILNMAFSPLGQSMSGKSRMLKIHTILVCVLSSWKVVQGTVVVDKPVTWSHWPVRVLWQREIWEGGWVIILSQISCIDSWSNDLHVVGQLTEVFKFKYCLKTLKVYTTLNSLYLRSILWPVRDLWSAWYYILVVKLIQLVISFVLVMDLILQRIKIMSQTTNLGDYLI